MIDLIPCDSYSVMVEAGSSLLLASLLSSVSLGLQGVLRGLTLSHVTHLWAGLLVTLFPATFNMNAC